MQLSPIAPVLVPTMPSIAAAPAAPSVSAPVAAAAPILDFPGVAAGQQFVVGRGSTAGKFGSFSGDANILSFDNDAAAFHIRASKFGLRIDMDVNVKRLDGDRVLLHTGGSGMAGLDSDIVARTVVSRTNYAEFVGVDDPSIHTIIQRDASGNIVIDAQVPQAGGPSHIVLNKR